MPPFHFKQFTVAQDKCAQKIGTDGVLIAAWTQPESKPATILDVGSGTGVIALILAQRFSSAQVDAVELDDAAHEQCTANFEEAPWGDRMFCYHASFQEFYEELEIKYDLIISNPPYFETGALAGDHNLSDERQLARFDTTLPFQHLLEGFYNMLEPLGTAAVVIPFTREKDFLELSETAGFYPSRITHVKGHKDASVKRSLIELRFRESGISTKTILAQELIIEKSRHVYTQEYVNLVQDFYLKM